LLLEALDRRLAEQAAKDAQPPAPAEVPGADPEGEPPPLHVRPRSILHDVEMGRNPDRKTYETEFTRLQGRLALAHRAARKLGLSTVVVFEGWDAAGKGSTIRRITSALDARHYRVVPIAAPTDEEKARHYLWRFWRRLGPAGSIVIFDRSWYGRVLVERVEGFAETPEWQRAYAEINHFERQITDHGTVVIKYWLHITPDEQLKRFQEREETDYKAWKITDEDWRNRDRWPDYERAVHDMVERTSTKAAPWTLVPANHKRHARLFVLQTLVDRLEAALPEAPEGLTAPDESVEST
ncbi:MAG: hypothetical protein KC583_23935, partial [Myxococcales bacterium]|nr:hypothetical protein [Myxococcales bacterium]